MGVVFDSKALAAVQCRQAWSDLTDMYVSEWLRLRRLQRCYDLLPSPQNATRSITEIAYSMGLSSSSHFSNLFRT
jgi:AraC-like DNA-binding protein